MDGAFRDRSDAGRRLAPAVAEWCAEAGWTAPVVLGIARGGVIVAAEVAHTLDAPLGVTVVRKLGAPEQPELAIGAIAPGVRVISPDAVRQSATGPEQLDFIEAMERVELARRRARYARGEITVVDRDVILVDDGVATGATATAACRSVRAMGGRRVLLAVPVAPAGWHPEYRSVDGYVCVRRAADFWAVGQFYTHFAPTSDAEIERLFRTDGPP